MSILDVVKRNKSTVALLTGMLTVGGTLFAKIDAYAQDKVDAGVAALRQETGKELTEVKTDIRIMKAEQQTQKEQLEKIDRKQDAVIDLLLDMKRK